MVAGQVSIHGEGAPQSALPLVRVLVVYEDTVTRDRAIAMSDRLMRQLWGDVDFEFAWWRFDYLEDPELARAAATEAAQTDVLVFSAHDHRELPPAIERWIESWLPEREHTDGVLGAVIGSDPAPGAMPVHVYLREVARRARMDFLPETFQALPADFDCSVEAMQKRATTKTSVLESILGKRWVPWTQEG